MSTYRHRGTAPRVQDRTLPLPDAPHRRLDSFPGGDPHEITRGRQRQDPQLRLAFQCAGKRLGGANCASWLAPNLLLQVHAGRQAWRASIDTKEKVEVQVEEYFLGHFNGILIFLYIKNNEGRTKQKETTNNTQTNNGTPPLSEGVTY